MLNQNESDGGVSFFEFRFRGVMPGDDFSGLRRNRDTRLPLRGLRTLKAAEAGEPAKHLVDLLLCDCFREFGTGTIKELLLVPIRDNRWKSSVSICSAFFVERVAAHCDESDSDGSEHNNDEEDDAENCEELFQGC